MPNRNEESEIVGIDCTDAEFDLMSRAAAEAGLSVEDWFRDQLIELAGRSMQPSGR